MSNQQGITRDGKVYSTVDNNSGNNNTRDAEVADTTVHKHQAPTVKHQTVKPEEHEEVKTKVDKDIHEDHYKHKVQPIYKKKEFGEQHEQRTDAVEEKNFDERDDRKTKNVQARQAGKFKDEREVKATKKTKSHGPVEENERVHQHIHETVQPVIHEEVVKPKVVHTTKPVHETHHKAAKYHDTETLPAVTAEEFEAAKGASKKDVDGSAIGEKYARKDSGVATEAGDSANAKYARKDAGKAKDDTQEEVHFPSLLDKLPAVLKPSSA
ncbi:Uu.00g042680.m01.CDS01 [Anthostomella pinea]|uniref:Uu.00g042680.m01.CDS01 n=1 Tax=Anthostomella pinea TaxID=933095 RepID=A0AAI8VBK3_9PEZI|nr:Uu.00g042680.m01.CDS01 [Anthostomella pinea]